MKPYLETCCLLVCFIVLTANLSSCRAPAAPDAGFIENPQVLANDKRLPFDAVWFKEGVDLNRYSKVYIAPIDTTHLLKLDWWERANMVKGTEQSQAASLTTYFKDKLAEAFKSQPKKTYTVVDTPDSESLRVELAIVEVVPTKVWLNAIGYLALGPLSSGTTAFEGRLRDSASNQVIAEFKDREYGQMDVVSTADLTWFSHSKYTIKTWSDQIAHICYRAPDESIAPMSTVTLRPW